MIEPEYDLQNDEIVSLHNDHHAHSGFHGQTLCYPAGLRTMTIARQRHVVSINMKEEEYLILPRVWPRACLNVPCEPIRLRRREDFW